MDDGKWGVNQEPRRGSQELCRTTLSLRDLIKERPASAQLHFRTVTDPLLKPTIFPLEKEYPPPLHHCVLYVECTLGEADNLPLWLQGPEDCRNYPQRASSTNGSDLDTSRLWCCNGNLEDPGQGWMCSACEWDPNHWGSEDRLGDSL